MWCAPVILAFRTLRQEDHECKATLSYKVKACLKNKKKRKAKVKSAV